MERWLRGQDGVAIAIVIIILVFTPLLTLHGVEGLGPGRLLIALNPDPCLQLPLAEVLLRHCAL